MVDKPIIGLISVGRYVRGGGRLTCHDTGISYKLEFASNAWKKVKHISPNGGAKW